MYNKDLQNGAIFRQIGKCDKDGLFNIVKRANSHVMLRAWNFTKKLVH